MPNRRVEPRPGQESVWDYPRPPRVESTAKPVRVMFGGEVIAETTRALRCLETSHPPTYYVPRADIVGRFLFDSPTVTVCEYKGVAHYVSLSVGDRLSTDAGWYYPAPNAAYAQLAGHVAFYPGRVDECTVDGERVLAQLGGFYGGWITQEIVGPFKGGPGTLGW